VPKVQPVTVTHFKVCGSPNWLPEQVMVHILDDVSANKKLLPDLLHIVTHSLENG